jgi:hypothetical protein
VSRDSSAGAPAVFPKSSSHNGLEPRNFRKVDNLVRRLHPRSLGSEVVCRGDILLSCHTQTDLSVPAQRQPSPDDSSFLIFSLFLGLVVSPHLYPSRTHKEHHSAALRFGVHDAVRHHNSNMLTWQAKAGPGPELHSSITNLGPRPSIRSTLNNSLVNR